MTLETLHTVEHLPSKKIVMMSSLDARMEDPNYRPISNLTRDLDYVGFVYKDKWGGVWRLKSTELEDISNAMEKWS